MTPRFDLDAIATAGSFGFGWAVAASGDTIVVGSLLREEQGKAGSVYVFVRDGAGWRQQACLKSGLARPPERFGALVAISGDTIVAAAVAGGQVEVFTRRGGAWTWDAALNTFGAAEDTSVLGHLIRRSLAIDGDTIVYGMPVVRYARAAGDPAGARAASFCGGAVLVYVRERGKWRRQAFLRAGKPWMTDYFGGAVALSGETLLVGAWLDGGDRDGRYPIPGQSPWEGSGAGYVFTRAAGVWTLQQYLKPARMGPARNFGFSVALEGDQAVIGAIRDGDRKKFGSDMAPGAAYVFSRIQKTWTQQTILLSRDKDANFGVFGYAVALRGDTAAISAPAKRYERWEKAAVGEERTSVALPIQGAVYLFERDGAQWRRQLVIRPNKAKQETQFALALALGDGVLVAGSRACQAAWAYPLPPAAKPAKKPAAKARP